MNSTCIFIVTEQKIMSHVYKRFKKARVQPLEVLERAAKEVRERNKSIRATARDEQMDQITLQSYIGKKGNEHVPVRKRGYDRVAEAHKVLSDMSLSLLNKSRILQTSFMGFSSLRCRELAYEFPH
jgi:hypothetical protein